MTTQEINQPLSVLLVEDDRIIQKIHKMLLQRMGHHVDIAANSKEAFAFLNKKHDMILMDIGLPGMSGIEIAAEIRRQEAAGCHIPIIAVTAFDGDDIKAECLAAGIDDVTTKPISFDQLSSIIKKQSRS